MSDLNKISDNILIVNDNLVKITPHSHKRYYSAYEVLIEDIDDEDAAIQIAKMVQWSLKLRAKYFPDMSPDVAIRELFHNGGEDFEKVAKNLNDKYHQEW